MLGFLEQVLLLSVPPLPVNKPYASPSRNPPMCPQYATSAPPARSACTPNTSCSPIQNPMNTTELMREIPAA